MNYNELVSKFRELSRDALRLRWVNNLRDSMLDYDNSIASFTKDMEYCDKQQAIASYGIAKLDEADPEYADKKTAFEETIEIHEETKKHCLESIAELTKAKAKVEEDIAKVSSGELKVDKDNLSAKAKELAEAYIKQKAIEIKE